MATNTGAWQTAAKATPLSISSAPYPTPSPNEIIVKNGALAINPVDWAIQSMGDALFKLPYPCILGSDLAGTIVEVGESVTRFKIRDRVLGLAVGTTSMQSRESAFQEFTVLKENVASAIPGGMSFEAASVIPLGMCTAASGLFQKDYLALEYPSVPPKPTGESLLVWGGSTSVGINAVQLAVSAGYEVIATAGLKNFDLMKKLGASHVFDYNSPNVTEDLIAAFKGKTSAGAIAIGSVHSTGNGAAAAEGCLKVVQKSEGKKFVAMAMIFPQEMVPEGVGAKFIFGSALKDNEVSKVIFEDFLPRALEAGQYIPAPEVVVVGKGLECIQEAFEVQKKGVSAKKVVVSL